MRNLSSRAPLSWRLLCPQSKVAVVCFIAAVAWLIVSVVSINSLASWYNTSAITMDDIGTVPPVSNISKAHESKALVKEHERVSARSRGQSDDNVIFKVHLWNDSSPASYGFREKELYSKDGFSSHRRTMLVDSPDDADITVWVSVRGVWENEVPPRNYSNVVLLDYSDGCGPLHQKRGELKHMIGYFKRSWVVRDLDGVYDRNCHSKEGVYPMAYSGIDALINEDINKERKILITNVLRTEGGTNIVRKKIVNWTRAFVEHHGLGSQSFIGNIGIGFSSSNWDMSLKSHLENSKIIVTCNPYRWEGDFRLWESLMSGALVMVDKMVIPDLMPHPLVHKKHLVFYDPTNQTEFDELLEYYVKHEDEAKQIGEAGYRHVLDHHMPKDRVSYILDTIESKIELHIDKKKET